MSTKFACVLQNRCRVLRDLNQKLLQICNRTHEESPRYGSTMWPTTQLNSASTVQCQYGGVASRGCSATKEWLPADWSQCNSVLTADIRSWIKNQSRNPEEILTELVNLTSNATILSIQDIINVVEYMKLNQTQPVLEENLNIISNILSIDATVAEGVTVAVISGIVKTVVKISQLFCDTRRVSVKLPYFSLTCAGWFNMSDRDSLLQINKNAGVLKLYKHKGQESDFIITVKGQRFRNKSIWNSTTIFSGSASVCAVVDINNGSLDKEKCSMPDEQHCECSADNGMIITLSLPQNRISDEQQSNFLPQACHVVAIAILVLTILGLLCKGSLSNPSNAINLNVATTALVAQAVLLTLTLPLDSTPVENLAIDEFFNHEQPKRWLSLRKKSCLIFNLISEYIHPTVLGWALASCVMFLTSQYSSVVIGYRDGGNLVVAKLAVAIYLLPLLLPISHSIYCSVTKNTTIETCFLGRSNSTCWGFMVDGNSAKLYTHYVPILLLILSLTISLLAIAWNFYTIRNKTGFIRSRSRAKFLLLCTVPLCTLYALHCTRAMSSVTALSTAFAFCNVFFALLFSIGVIGHMRFSYNFIHFQVHADSQGRHPKVKRTPF